MGKQLSIHTSEFFGRELTKRKLERLIAAWEDGIEALAVLSLVTKRPVEEVVDWYQGRAVMPRELRYLTDPDELASALRYRSATSGGD